MEHGYIAVLRRFNGRLYKVSKSAGMPATPHGTSPLNLSSYFRRWSTVHGRFIAFGTTRGRTATAFQQQHACLRIMPSSSPPLPLADDAAVYGGGAATATDPPPPPRRGGGGRGGGVGPGRNSPDGDAERRPRVRKKTTSWLAAQAAAGKKLTMVTCYDRPSALAADAADVDLALVGDSVGMVALGMDSTVSVTLDHMVHHCAAVTRGGGLRCLTVGDMPFGSYNTPALALASATRLLKEGGADMVKLEGGRRVVPIVRTLVDAGIAVIGHVGLTPQSYVACGGYRCQGRTDEAAAAIAADAAALEDAGVHAIVVECVPSEIAERVTAAAGVPTIGIGSGRHTDGQVLVWHDLLGLSPGAAAPRLAHRYARLAPTIEAALSRYVADVRNGAFPRRAQITHLDPSAAPPTRARVLRSIADLRRWRAEMRAEGRDVGFVPTMGCLHDGHISLVRESKAACGATVASVFVNPTQFAPGEDLDAYPRTWEADLGALEAAGVDAVFAPRVAEMYPMATAAAIMQVHVDPSGVETATGEGRARTHFFRGVATVVTKLFNAVQPDKAFFGQKDFVQTVVIRRLVQDLLMPIDVVVCPTARAPDGLALSSRNTYLSTEQRAAAPVVYRALCAARDAANSMAGATVADVSAAAAAVLDTEPLVVDIDYVTVADADTARELSDHECVWKATVGDGTSSGGSVRSHGQRVVVSVAVRMEGVRLIDNIVVDRMRP